MSELAALSFDEKKERWDYVSQRLDYAAMLEAEAEFSFKRMERINQVTRNQTFDNFICRSTWQGALYETAKNYADAPQGWFYAGGQSGCGKTHLCMAICDQLQRKDNLWITFCSWREDAAVLKNFNGDNNYARTELLKRLKNAKNLFIDDFLKGSTSSIERQIAYEIIDYRYRLQFRTIISSEYTLGKLIDVFDPAVGGRISEMCGKNVIAVREDYDKNYRTGAAHNGNF